MKNSFCLLYAILLSAVFSVLVFGQTANYIVSPGIKGVPFSAESVTETVQTLADGNKITRRSRYLQYRDGEGRSRSEMAEQSDISPITSAQFRRIWIIDPVSRYTYFLDPSNKTVTRSKRPDPTTLPRPTIRLTPPTGYSYRNEEIGTRVIDGIENIGKRYTQIIAPGTIGNEKVIEVVTESWSDPILRVVMLSVTNDPRSGVTNTRLTNIKREEPDKSLFEVPADYKITEQPMRTPILPSPTTPNENSGKEKDKPNTEGFSFYPQSKICCAR